MRDRRASALVFAALLFSYAWFFGGSGFNQNSTFALTRAIVERQQLNIDPNPGNTADVSFYGGRLYSNKAPGLAILAAVPYSLLHATYGPPRDTHTLNVFLYVCTVAVCGVSGALLGMLVFAAVRHRGASTLHAYAVAMVVGLGTPLFAYSTMLFPHVVAALLSFVAFLFLDGTLRRNPYAAGAAAGAATCTFYLCAPLAVLLLFFTGSRRDSIRVALGGLPFAGALALYQYSAFGSPFRTSIATENQAFHEPGALLGVLHPPELEALWGITFSPYRGLFFIAPILLLAVILLRERFAWLAFTIVLLINASFFGWHGGYAIGPRYLLHVIPFLALGLTRLGRYSRVAAIGLGAVSLIFNLAVTAVDPQPPDTLQDPIGRYALPSLLTGTSVKDPHAPWLAELYTGHTSTNRVAPDEMLPFQRHAPGSAASEWASFNLGELLFGPGSFASILPWLAGLGAIILVLRASLRGRHRDSEPTRDTQAEKSRSA